MLRKMRQQIFLAPKLQPNIHRCHTTRFRVLPAGSQSLHNAGVAISPEAAWQTITDFSKQEFRGLAQSFISTPQQRAALREALMTAYRAPNTTYGWQAPPKAEVLIGIVAGDVRLGLRALRDWCQHLNLELCQPVSRVPGVSDISQVTGGVYIKYVSTTKLCYLTQYDGRDRGVLLQLGQRQFGHFPLGLFDEEMQAPAPLL